MSISKDSNRQNVSSVLKRLVINPTDTISGEALLELPANSRILRITITRGLEVPPANTVSILLRDTYTLYFSENLPSDASTKLLLTSTATDTVVSPTDRNLTVYVYGNTLLSQPIELTFIVEYINEKKSQWSQG